MIPSKEGYLIPQQIELCFFRCPDLNLSLLPTANVVAVFSDSTGNNTDFILCEINPPDEMCKMYLHSTKETSILHVTQIFRLIQQEAYCWSIL